MASVKVGDKVTTSATHDVNGTSLAPFVRSTTFTVMSVSGTSAVIGLNGQVTARVSVDTLTVQGSTKSTDVNKTKKKTGKEATEKTGKISSPSKLSQGIEDGLVRIIKSGNSDELLKYNMRLFGSPHQFTPYCDYRTYSVSEKSKNQLLGRKYIENISLEAPVLTVIPGKPKYLPGAKNKRGLTYALMEAANDNLGAITGLSEKEMEKDKELWKKLKYYDFQQDYLEYTKYVNIMCSTAAAFLDLDKETLDGVQLSSYDWKDYRWNATAYKSASGSLLGISKEVATSFVKNLRSQGKSLWNAVTSTLSGDGHNKTNKKAAKKNLGLKNLLLSTTTDEKMLAKVESMLTQTNFVQFYVDSSGGISESADNSTSESMIASRFNGVGQTAKEIGFIANSGGIDDSSLTEYLKGATDGMIEFLDNRNNSLIGGMVSRLLQTGSGVIKGENMIFPEIYQQSKYNKSYQVTVDLRAPYGNRLSYFLDVVVPLMHLMGLVLPKQTTANTYGSPFLVKAYLPGQFSCNLGIVSNMTVDRNPSGDSWTIDGYPNNIKVTLTITDLYSDLTMTPAGSASILLFMNNSSLIEFIATNCGVNLTVPQLSNRVSYAVSTVQMAMNEVDTTVSQSIFGAFEDLISGITGV